MDKINDQNYLEELFIDEVKPALDRWNNAGGGGGGITPTGTKEITENGTHDVTEYASVDVNVESSGGDTLSEFLKVRNGQYLFYECGDLTSVPLFDASVITDMSYMFAVCSQLTSIPRMDTGNVTAMDRIFSSCGALTSIPALDTRNVTSMSYAFSNCGSLTSVGEMDIRNVTSASSIFYGCTSLTDVNFKNIRAHFQLASETAYGQLLTADCLIKLIYELRDVSSNRNFTIGSTNLDKLASVYVKTVDITDEMRAADDLVDQKLPFVVCDSTDEGAMLITDYTLLKRWTIK